MKTTIAITFLFLVFGTIGKSQELSPQIVTSAGGSYEADGISLSWTLGEPVIETFTSNDLILTQGFHQAGITVSANNNPEIEGLDIKVYPNPAGEYVHIDLTSEQLKHITIELFNMDGEKVLIKQDFVIENKDQLHLKDFPAGTYILRIINKDQIKTYKIMKME